MQQWTRCQAQQIANYYEIWLQTLEWFNKESNWFLYTITIYQYTGIFALLLWADSNYFRERKRKCGISNADAERQVARLYKKNASKNATLFPFLLAPIPQGKRPEWPKPT